METQKGLFARLGETIDQYRAEQRERRAEQSAAIKEPGRLSHLVRWLMPNGGTLLIVLALILTQQVWARNLQAPAAPGPSATTVNYQGRLANNSGAPLDGTFGMTFAIFDASTGGNIMWGPESHAAVPVSNGLFSVGLGSQTAGGIPTNVWNGDRYLEITVGGETLSPRELIRSVPIAGMALTMPDGAIGTSQIADGNVTTSKLASGAVSSDKLKPTTGIAKITTTQVVQLQTNWVRATIPQTSFTINLASNSRVLIWFTASARAPASGTTRWSDVILNIDNSDAYVSTTVIDGQFPAFNFSGATLVNLSAGAHTVSLQVQSGLVNDAITFEGGRTNIMYMVISQ